MSTQAVSVEPQTVAELIANSKQNPLIWMIPDVVQEDGIHILHGAEESFKTMLTLQLHEALTVGKPFLLREVKGSLRTGIAELEMKARPFGSRLGKFFPGQAPDIHVLPEKLRRNVLSGPAPKDRIRFIANWAKNEGLDFLSIDSAVKLFPSGLRLTPSLLPFSSDAQCAVSLRNERLSEAAAKCRSSSGGFAFQFAQ